MLPDCKACRRPIEATFRGKDFSIPVPPKAGLALDFEQAKASLLLADAANSHDWVDGQHSARADALASAGMVLMSTQTVQQMTTALHVAQWFGGENSLVSL